MPPSFVLGPVRSPQAKWSSVLRKREILTSNINARDETLKTKGANAKQGGPNACLQKGIFNGSNFNLLDDYNTTIVYSGVWSIVFGNATAGDFTQHETNSQNASVFAPFYGSQITVVGTIPNGTDNIFASYSIDGAPLQTRSVPPNTGCDIPVAPFFAMEELTEGYHNITITVEQVESRPFMFNFFALDPKEPDIGTRSSTPKTAAQGPQKLNVGEIAGVAAAGFFLCIIVLLVFFVFRRISDRLKRRKVTVRVDDANSDNYDPVSSRSTLNFDAVLDPSPLERAMSLSELAQTSTTSPGPPTFNHDSGQQISSQNREKMSDMLVEGMQPSAIWYSGASLTNDSDRVSIVTRATRGSRGSATALVLPPLLNKLFKHKENAST